VPYRYPIDYKNGEDAIAFS
jgi:succinyl-CoA synthetase beta subunit